MHSPLRAACALAVVSALGGAASADVLFNNFAANDEYDTERGWTMSYGGPLGGDVYEQAAPFTVTGGDYYFDSAEVAVLHNWGPDLIYFNLHADEGGVPGAILDSTTASGVAPPFELRPPMVADFGGDFVLKDGQTYWLALRTEETDALVSWAFNIVDDFGLRAQQLNDGPWEAFKGDPGTDSERGVYRINATPVPAPAALPLLALAGAWRLRRERA
ncbi:MAG TPA: MYXO-CTERM sorting domain-containing protein [Phycisphaerales bacterium]|nr:MYXO-CTERM sorting domain-containing protein [Phycisphaerales bacterium]